MKNRINIIPIISFLLFIIVFILLKIGIIYTFDNYVYEQFIINDFLTSIMVFITFFGEAKTIFYITILLLLFLKKRKYKIMIVINSLIGLNVFHTLKIIIKRPRPTGINLVDVTGYSFPSGHTYMTIIFYGLLLYLINTNKEKIKCKNLLNIILVLIIITVPISRVYLGVHYASDTIAGFTLGLIHLFLFISLAKNKKLL